jgi:hypothetical protein
VLGFGIPIVNDSNAGPGSKVLEYPSPTLHEFAGTRHLRGASTYLAPSFIRKYYLTLVL